VHRKGLLSVGVLQRNESSNDGGDIHPTGWPALTILKNISQCLHTYGKSQGLTGKSTIFMDFYLVGGFNPS